jgi:hypothetical protein
MDIPEATENFKKVAANLEAHIAAIDAKAKSLWTRWEVYTIALGGAIAGGYLTHRFGL